MPQVTLKQWWIEADVDGCWHIGSGNRGFADLGEGSEAEATAKAIKDAHNAEIHMTQQQQHGHRSTRIEKLMAQGYSSIAAAEMAQVDGL